MFGPIHQAGTLSSGRESASFPSEALKVIVMAAHLHFVAHMFRMNLDLKKFVLYSEGAQP